MISAVSLHFGSLSRLATGGIELALVHEQKVRLAVCRSPEAVSAEEAR